MTYKALTGFTLQFLGETLVFYDPPYLCRSKGAGSLLVPRIMKARTGDRAMSYKRHSYRTVFELLFRTQDIVSVFKPRLKT